MRNRDVFRDLFVEVGYRVLDFVIYEEFSEEQHFLADEVYGIRYEDFCQRVSQVKIEESI